MDTEKDDDVKLGERWCKRVAREIKAHKKWRDDAKIAVDAYRDERDDNLHILYPIWWTTVQITHAAIYSNSPKPDVRKRYNDQDFSNDRLALAIERILSFTTDTTYFDDNGHLAVDDFLVAGCGQCKIELETETQEIPVLDPISQVPILGANDKPQLQKVITNQTLKLRHFSWENFGWEPGKDWDSVSWVRFTHNMTEDEIEQQFSLSDKDIEKICGTDKGDGEKKYAKTYAVHEIWDKKDKKRLFVCLGLDQPLEVSADPLKLSGFFPCPKPMMTNIKGTELLPKPDYHFIAKQCDSINGHTARISALMQQIKDVGFYDSQLTDLALLTNARDGTLVPIKNLADRLQGKTDFSTVIAKQDNQDAVITMRELLSLRDIEKSNVFETIGISDIIRGASVASETAAAQTIKAQWANVRIGPKIKAMGMFFRESFRIMSELAAEHFTPEQITKMTGMQLTPEEFAALKDDMSRIYAIDVETDSTLAADDAEERTQRLEYVKTATDYMNVLIPMVQNNAIPADFAKQILLFASRSFKYGRQLEESIQKLPDNMAQLQGLQQQGQQVQQQLEQVQQQLNESVQKGQQMEQQLSHIDQSESGTNQAKVQIESQKNQAEAQRKAAELQLEAEKVQSAIESDRVTDELTRAEIEKVHAETEKLRMETMMCCQPETPNIGMETPDMGITEDYAAN